MKRRCRVILIERPSLAIVNEKYFTRFPTEQFQILPSRRHLLTGLPYSTFSIQILSGLFPGLNVFTHYSRLSIRVNVINHKNILPF